MAHWTGKLKKMDACQEAIDWAKQYPNLQAAWDNCPRADWMLWLAAHQGLTLDRHCAMVRAVCQMVRRQLHHVSPAESEPLRAIEAAEKWAANPTTANANAAWEVAPAAEWATTRARAAWAADAAWAAAKAAAWAEADAAREVAEWARVATEKMAAEAAIQADILRQHLTCPERDER